MAAVGGAPQEPLNMDESALEKQKPQRSPSPQEAAPAAENLQDLARAAPDATPKAKVRRDKIAAEAPMDETNLEALGRKATSAKPDTHVKKEKLLAKERKAENIEDEPSAKRAQATPANEAAQLSAKVRGGDASTLIREALAQGRHLKDSPALCAALLTEGRWVKTLDLHGLKPNEEDIQELCKVCPNLMVLNVKDCGLNDAQVEEIAKLRSLIHLDIGGDNDFTAEKGLVALAKQQSLKQVSFDGCTKLFTHCMNHKESLDSTFFLLSNYMFEWTQFFDSEYLLVPSAQTDSRNAVVISFINQFTPFLQSNDKNIFETFPDIEKVGTDRLIRFSENVITKKMFLSVFSENNTLSAIIDLRGKTVTFPEILYPSFHKQKFLFDGNTTINENGIALEENQALLNRLLSDELCDDEREDLTPLVNYLLIKTKGDITKLPENVRPNFLKLIGNATSLSLENISLTNANIAIFTPHFSKLQSLNLKNTNLSDESLLKILESAPLLREIHVDGNPNLSDTSLQPLFARNFTTITFANTKVSDPILQTAFEKQIKVIREENTTWKNAIEKSSLSAEKKKELQAECDLIEKNALSEMQLFPENPFTGIASVVQEKIITSFLHAMTTFEPKEEGGEPEYKLNKDTLNELFANYATSALLKYEANINHFPISTPFLKEVMTTVTKLSFSGMNLDETKLKTISSQFPKLEKITFTNCHIAAKALELVIKKVSFEGLAISTIDGTQQELADLLAEAYISEGEDKDELIKILFPKIDPKAKVKFKHGLSPLVIACDPRLEAIALDFLKRGASGISTADTIVGATPFHVACQICSSQLIFAFLERSTEFDPLQKNKEGKTPFSLLGSRYSEPERVKLIKEVFSGYDTICDFSDQLSWKDLLKTLRQQRDPSPLLKPSDAKKLQPIEVVFLLESPSSGVGMIEKLPAKELVEAFQFLLKKYPLSNPTAFIESLFFHDKELLKNPEVIAKAVEAAFLMKNTQLIDRLLLEIEKKQDFNDAMNTVEQLHKDNPEWEKFAGKIGEINQEHLKMQTGITQIPPLAKDVALEGFLTIFDSINFSDAALPNYINPEQILREAGVKTIAELRKGLFHTKIIKEGDAEKEVEAGLIGYVKRRIPYLGTPTGPDQVNFFYTQIERAMKHVLFKLNQLPNTPEANLLRAKTVVEFARACPPRYCGGRIFTNALALYNQVVEGIKQTFENKVYQSLADYRDTLLQSIMVGQDVHEYTFLARVLGKELGIGTADLMIKFDDIFVPAYIQKGDTAEEKADSSREYTDLQRTKFFERYTPSSIVSGWLTPQLETDQTLKNECIDWFKEHAPADFEAKKFRAIKALVKPAILGRKSLDAINDEVFEKFGIELSLRTFEDELKGAIDSSVRDQIDSKRQAIEEEIEAFEKPTKTDVEIRTIIKEKYGIDLEAGDMKQAVEKAVKLLDAQGSMNSEPLRKEVLDLQKPKKSDEEIRQFIKDKYQIDSGAGSIQRALNKAMDDELKSTKEKFSKDILTEVDSLRHFHGASNEGIAKNLREHHNLRVFGYSIERSIEEARRRLYLEKEVIYTKEERRGATTTPKMHFREERVYDLCKELKILRPLTVELEELPMQD